MAAELILHHYDFSNYSEKVRLVLGLKGLSWRSVDIPPVLPKPDYLPLTGGYRRAPALQIGADVFCDTKRISEELERRFPEPSIYPGPDVAAQRTVLAGLEYWTDSAFTRNAINYISCMHAEAPRFTPEFLADRAALLHKPEPGLAHRRAAATKNLAQLRPQLSWISEVFSDGRPYVWGETMSLADCVIYHPLWVMDQLAGERGETDEQRGEQKTHPGRLYGLGQRRRHGVLQSLGGQCHLDGDRELPHFGDLRRPTTVSRGGALTPT